MDLFQSVNFISHAGIPMTWKIECDAISPQEWVTLAQMIKEHEHRPWQKAVGIPRGGVALGEALDAYSTGNPNDPILIADDVYTTGTSFREFKEE
jgi:hypoxanthine phosphoribosyltransferase